MNSVEINIQDLIDIPALQDLLNSYSQQTGIPTAILNLKGDILAATGWQKICTEFHRKHKDTALKCLESDTVLASKLPEGKRYNIYKCKNGLYDVATPINVESMHIGNLFIGQFLLNPPDNKFFTQQAEKYDFDKELYLESLSNVPVFSIEQINSMVDFLANLTTVIGNSGLDKKKLIEMNKNLEQLIQERTAELEYSNERLQVLTEASFEGIFLVENGVIIEANYNVATMFGFQQETELIGMKVSNIIASETHKDVIDKVASGYDRPYESLGLHKNGNVFPIEVCGKTFSYQGRQVRGTAVRDLSDRKKAEKEIQALRDILPICSFCKKIRDDKGYWERVDIYIRNHSFIDFSHSVCPECLKEHYPEEYKKIKK